MKCEYTNLSPKENTYLEIQTAINFVVDTLGRQFYWASREDMSDSFTKEQADELYDIMRSGNENHELMVRSYWNPSMQLSEYEFEKIKKWAEKVNKKNELFDHRYTKLLKRYMESMERCFETITSNEWIR